jgi:chemotaxis protein histidine kinase CheA
MPKTADPYLMNQDHVNQQPKPDAYVTGDPSTFAEDVHPSAGTWGAEYSGGEVKRNEVGMPEMRKDTFNHPEKTAADHALLLKKADICIRVASRMLGKRAAETLVEDQAVALMHLPDEELVHTFNRLAEEQPIQSGMQQQAQQQAQAAYQQAQAACKQAIEAGDMEAAQQCMAQMQQAKQAIESATYAQQAPAQQVQAQDQTQDQAQDQQKQASAKRADDIQSMVQQAVQQAMAQQQVPQTQQAQQQAPQEPVAHDDALLDDMLMGEPAAPMSEVDIEMEPSPMDISDSDLGPEDEVLMSLFANDESQAQQAKEEQAEGQQKQANIRTASNRTVGTRPTQGVSRVGGGVSGQPQGQDVGKLASLWATAPDVSEAFR